MWYFLLFNILVGRFPELTPVHSQTTKLWLSTLDAGDTWSILSAFLKLLLKLAYSLLLRASSGDTSQPITLGVFRHYLIYAH